MSRQMDRQATQLADPNVSSDEESSDARGNVARSTGLFHQLLRQYSTVRQRSVNEEPAPENNREATHMELHVVLAEQDQTTPDAIEQPATQPATPQVREPQTEVDHLDQKPPKINVGVEWKDQDFKNHRIFNRKYNQENSKWEYSVTIAVDQTLEYSSVFQELEVIHKIKEAEKNQRLTPEWCNTAWLVDGMALTKAYQESLHSTKKTEPTPKAVQVAMQLLEQEAGKAERPRTPVHKPAAMTPNNIVDEALPKLTRSPTFIRSEDLQTPDLLSTGEFREEELQYPIHSDQVPSMVVNTELLPPEEANSVQIAMQAESADVRHVEVNMELLSALHTMKARMQELRQEIRAGDNPDMCTFEQHDPDNTGKIDCRQFLKMVESEMGRTGKNMRSGGKPRLREWEFKEIWADMEDTGDAMVNKREFLDSLEKFAEQHPECRGKRGIKILKSYCEETIKHASNDLSMSDEDLQKDDPDAPYQQDNDSLMYKIYKTMNRKHRCDIWNHPESYQNPWRLFSWIVCMFMILVSLVALTYSFAGSFQHVEQMQWMRSSWEPVVAAISILNMIVLALRIFSCRNPCYIFAKSETVEDADEDDEESYMTWFFWPNYAHAMNFVDLAACFPIVFLAIGGSRNNGWIRALMLLTLGHTRRLKAMQMSLTVPAETLFKSWEESGKLFFFVAFVMLACNAAIFELEKGTPYSKCPAARTKTLCGAGNLKDKCWWSGESSRCVGLRFREGEDSASPYKSYAHTFWFTVTTMSTVGYGDMSPKTPLGQAVGIFTMLSLVLVFSVFAVAIFPSNFEAARQLYINREIERKVFADMAQRDAKMAQRVRNRAQIVIVQA